jgi:2-hydroxychromene-2-carboxylate isomerase
LADPRLKVVQVAGGHPAVGAQPIFYYDLGNPACYLAAERIMGAMPVAPEWEPVSAVRLNAAEPAPDRRQFERLAADRGLQPFRWPARWPPDSQQAMLAATYAKRIGRAVAFSLAAFRQAFAGGRDLGDENTVLIAAAACEIHPTALLQGISLRSVAGALANASERARAAGISSLPAIQVGTQVFHGEGGIDDATAALTRSRGG